MERRPQVKGWKFFITQLTLCLSLIMITSWIFRYKGGFSKEHPSFPFNLHPFFMSFAFVFCLGEAIISFTTLPFEHRYRKWIHATFHTLALLFVLIGTWATFQFHHNISLAHLYSIHSWFGIITVSMFILQWVIGLYSYLFHVPSLYFRASFLPIHRFFGATIFTLGVAVAIMGLLENQTFNQVKGNQGLFDSVSMFANATALCYLAAVLAVLGLLYTSKVEDREEYSTLLTGSSEYREAAISSM